MDEPQALPQVIGETTSDVALMAKVFKKRIVEDKDLVVAICGPEGVGKSTLAIQLARAYDPLFTIDRNVILNPDSKAVVDKIINLPKESAIVVDEAINVMLKDEHYSKIQIFLKKIFATARKANKLILLCMPYFNDFSLYWRKHRIKVWLQVVDRGEGVAFVRDSINIFTEDPWNMRKNEKALLTYTEKKQLGSLSKNTKYYLYQKATNYWRAFTYEQLPWKLEKEYKEKASKVLSQMEEEKPNFNTLSGKVWRERLAILVEHLMLEKGYAPVDVARIIGLKPDVVSKLVKERHGITPSELRLRARSSFFKTKKDTDIKKEDVLKLEESHVNEIGLQSTQKIAQEDSSEEEPI